MMNRTSLCISALSVAVVCSIGGGCGSSSFVRQPAGWKSIELREGLQGNYNDAWQTAVDTVARSYDIEVMEKDSGYIRTSWKYGILGKPTSVLAGRLVVKFPSTQSPTKVDVKTDAQQFNAWTNLWEEGFDSRFERDVMGELSGRLGRTTQE